MMSSGIVSGAILSFVAIITEGSSAVILYNNSTMTLTTGTYLETHHLREFFDGMVCNSGSDIYYFDPALHIKNNYLTPDTLNLIMNTFQDCDFLTVAFHNGHKLITTNDDIKMIADYVTEKTNHENGIVDFLKKNEAFFLIWIRFIKPRILFHSMSLSQKKQRI